MKIALAYPKIPDTKDFLPRQCVAYKKYDGTNIHWVASTWLDTSCHTVERRDLHRRRACPFQWTHFGTRRDQFSYTKEGWIEFHSAHPGMADLKKVFSRFEAGLRDILYRQRSGEKVIVFTEYFGTSSFAGEHKSNERHELRIIDIHNDGQQIDLKRYINNTFVLPFAEIVYEGKYSGQLVQDIRAGKYYDGEGAVLKGEHKGQIYMAKVKTDKYMRSLQMKFKENWKDYWE